MRPDPGRAIQGSVIARMTVEQRQGVRIRLAERARLLAWQQAEAAGPMTELERAEFLLRRLYPSMPEAALRQVLEQLAAAEARGTWDGFRPPHAGSL